MPLGTPELLDSFMLGGYKLQATAPEEFTESVKAAFRFFFFAKGPTKVQKGRVVPGPIRLSFKFNGEQALNAARFLKQMAKSQNEIKLSWAKWFSFGGYLTDFEWTYRQKFIVGTLTYQPTTDYLRNDFSGGLTQPFKTSGPAIDPQQVKNAIGGIQGFLDAVNAALTNLQTQLVDDFAPVYAFNDAAENAIASIQQAQVTFGDVFAAPFDTVNALWSTTVDALDLVGGARDYLNATVLDPTIPLLEGTSNYLAQAFGLQALAGIDDSETQLGLIANGIKPAPGQYEVQDGDSLDIVADLFGVGVGDILQLNPGLSASTLAPGQVLKVPQNGND